MKNHLFLFCTISVLLLLPGMAFSEEAPDYRELTGIVFEWTPNGDMIQIENLTISGIKSVWLDEGKGDEGLIRVNKSYIKEGKLARALLLDKDRNGLWIAEKIIVFSGKGLDDVMKRLTRKQKRVLSGE